MRIGMMRVQCTPHHPARGKYPVRSTRGVVKREKSGGKKRTSRNNISPQTRVISLQQEVHRDIIGTRGWPLVSCV